MLKVAALQLRTSPDRTALIARAAALIEEAAQRGARVICLPEAFTGLYGAKHFADNAEEWRCGAEAGTTLLAESAAKHGIFTCGGVIERHPISSKLFNTIAAFDPRGVEVARYRKIHLSRVSVGGVATAEGDVLEAGDALSWFDVPAEVEDAGAASPPASFRFGLANCFDLRFAELHTLLTRSPPEGVGAEVVLYPASWLAATGELGHWETLLTARALDAQCYVVGVSNARDEDHETVAFGRSCIVGPMGDRLAVCDDDATDEVVFAELSLSALVEARQRIPLRSARRPLVYADALRAQQHDPRAMGRAPPEWRGENPSRQN